MAIHLRLLSLLVLLQISVTSILARQLSTICTKPSVILAVLLLQPFLVVVEAWLWLRIRGRSLLLKNAAKKSQLLVNLGFTNAEEKHIVGFWHPYCNAGGGGERVLWTAIAAMQRSDPNVISVVYSGDIDTTKAEIIKKVKSRFDIALDHKLLHFVFLQNRHLVEDKTWPRFTLLGQSVGSVYLVWEGLSQFVPDLFIDSMGYAFTFNVVSLLVGIPIGAYVHYPTISTDMLARVQLRKAGHTNSAEISRSVVLSQAKLLYYRVFMYYYAISLKTANFIMVNSTWTKDHVDSILQHSDTLLDLIHLLPPLLFLRLFLTQNSPKSSRIVYPPCDTREMAKFSLTARERVVLSVAQFRPEKDHVAQIRSFDILLRSFPECKPVKLVLVGGSRNDEDAARVENFRQLVRDLRIEEHVQFVVNAPYTAVLEWLSKASIGLSTMVDEHFGINIVEYMAAGVIPVAHKSGGPLKDIIVPFDGEQTGFHARTPEEFAQAMHDVLSLSTEQEHAMRWRARAWAVQRFSEEEFEKGWNQSGWRNYLPPS